MAEAEIVRRSRLRMLSLAVLVLVVGIAVTGCLVTRQVVDDQEHKLLKQRADEAALYLSSAVSAVQTELASLAASAAATHEQPGAFEASTKLLTALPQGFSNVALIKVGPPPTVLASSGTGFPAGLGAERSAAVQTAVAKVGLTGSLVATPLFAGTGGKRELGFAYATPSLPDAVVYAETAVRPRTATSTTSSQPFSELVAAVYATPTPQPDQLIALSAKTQVPLTGHTVSVPAPIGQGSPWLLVAKARRPLVGSVATWTPWAILGGGLLAALLATAIVETLARRREYALGLVNTRTEELRQSLDDLASAHEQLVRQERLAAIGELASTIGHELRNPLGVISNAVFLLRKDFGPNPGEAAARHLETAEREVSAATVIVSDLLEFTRQRQPVLAEVDVVALVDEVLAILPPPTGVVVDRAPVTGAVVAPLDRDMMRQVLLNLVGNGYQAMPAGGRLTVGVAAHDGAVTVSLADTGPGVEAGAKDRLFEPFFTTKSHGVGLGLSVCKRIVEAHGGQIQVDSEPGEGARFTVALPVIATQRVAAESSEARPNVPAK